MMYRHNQATTRRRRSTRRRQRPSWLWVSLAVAGALLLFISLQKRGGGTTPESLLTDDDVVVDESEFLKKSGKSDQHRVYRRRLSREAVPAFNYYAINYRSQFNDSNYVQLSAARANGIDPQQLVDPANHEKLVPIFTTPLYRVDTMYHSVPYLVPEAVLLLDYIGHRFMQLMSQHYPSIGDHKIIVTSALRTERSERQLKRVNRNATDTSCHIYGTTFDLSAQRYEHLASGHDTVVDACRQMLAMALFELRYEGLCYVKYERGSCFHITLRTTQYEGNESSEMRGYINPGSPDYLLTKSPPRPKAPRGNVETPKVKKEASGRASSRKSARQKKQPLADAVRVSRHENTGQDLTERERMSLENYERRGY